MSAGFLAGFLNHQQYDLQLQLTVMEMVVALMEMVQKPLDHDLFHPELRSFSKDFCFGPTIFGPTLSSDKKAWNRCLGLNLEMKSDLFNRILQRLLSEIGQHFLGSKPS